MKIRILPALQTLLKASSFACILCSSLSATANTFFFPGMKPTVTHETSPDWLKNGASGDGYVSISSETISIGSCARLSSTSFWGSEKEQLVLSIVSNGFKSKLDKVEIPIATFDGRNNAAECTSLSTTPQQIVPLAILGTKSLLNPGKLTITLNVKSATDSQTDYVGSAKLLLGAATLIASGGSAALVGGATATMGNSVLSDTEAKANKLLKGMTDAKVPISLNWNEIRSGIKSIEIPVYRAEQSLSSVTDKKIQQLQTDPEADKMLLLNVHLDFTYARTLFYPSVDDLGNLSIRENISRERILNTQAPGSNLNFMQILNSGVPSQLKIMSYATGSELSRACSQSFEKLKGSGIANPDIAIVMKSFIDEARGGTTWYNESELVKNCFGQSPKVEEFLYLIYGKIPSQ